MEINRNKEELNIIMKYKISKRKVNNKKGTGYQYIVRLPPFLVSFFNITDYKATEENPNCLCFYEYENKFYITEAKKYMEEGNHKINMKIKDSTLYNSLFMQVNKTQNTGYQYTLPLKMFKEYMKPHENQYIQYTIHTGKEDINYNKGLVELTVITE